MDAVLNTVLAIIIIMMITLQGAKVLHVNTEVVTVNNYLEEVSRCIAESNYNESIIRECETEAEGLGYGLTVTAYGESGTGPNQYAEIVIRYPYERDFKTKRKII